MNIQSSGDRFDIVRLTRQQLERILYALDYDALEVAAVFRPVSDIDVVYHPERTNKPYSIGRVQCDEYRALEKLTEAHGERTAKVLMAFARIEGRALAHAERLKHER
ncbi:hypothetical protein [Lacipirellula parvula]|uniref:Uncharacterized protein n=1 Tax=Lacipirellula parvula TaxID=2650471 RepID=A0A5K7X7F7_9BACT|nr:hypothetical protein [Lacipirellula parvula]BBO32540.1 hypothetical protein PLANPX_2152 [Lacipirellula parvula]